MIPRLGQELGVVAEEDLDTLSGPARTLRGVDTRGKPERDSRVAQVLGAFRQLKGVLPMLILIAAPRGWGAMRVAQERYVSVMSWIEHVRASRLIGNLLTERTAAQEVRIHAVGPFLLSRYQRMAESAEAEQERLASSKAVTEWFAAAMSGLAMAATYGTMFWLIMSGHMSLAVAGTAVIAVRSGSASLGALVMNVNQLHEESLYIRDHSRFLDESATRAIPDGGDPVPAQVKQVVLDQVTYRYPDREAAALDCVSLTLPMGSVTAVVGENGSGKSTLMKVLSGLLLPQSGTVLWGDAEVAPLDRSQVFDRVALLTQDFQRWPVTAALNIRIGRSAHEATPEDLQPSVDYAGAGPVIAKLPDGLQSLLARMFRGASELSGGEWQKVGQGQLTEHGNHDALMAAQYAPAHPIPRPASPTVADPA